MKRIVLTAGHDPAARGAAFPSAGVPVFVEHEEAIVWVARIASEFTRLGGDALVLPSNNLEQLVKTIHWINGLNPRAEAAVEIHFNDARTADGRQVGRGCETLIAPKSVVGKRVGDAIQAVLAQHFQPDRGCHDGWLRGDRPGVVDYPGDHDGDERLAGYLIETNCPAVIVEPDFVVNHVRIRAHRDACCIGIARALRAL